MARVRLKSTCLLHALDAALVRAKKSFAASARGNKTTSEKIAC